MHGGPHAGLAQVEPLEEVLDAGEPVAVLLDEQGWTHLVVQELVGDEQARVRDALAGLELAPGGEADRFAALRVVLAFVEVDADAAVGGVAVRPGRVVVLPGRTGLVGLGLDAPRSDRDRLLRAVGGEQVPSDPVQTVVDRVGE